MAEAIRELIREYQDGKIGRRAFMRKVVALTGSVVAAKTFIDGFVSTGAHAAQVDPSDPTLLWHDVEYQGKATPVFGYLARPAAIKKFPAIIVIHANQGLNDSARDVARRLAKQGYVALAVDYLSRHGGTKKVNPKGEGLSNIRDLAPWYGVAEDTDSGFAFLRTLPDVQSRPLGVDRFLLGRRNDICVGDTGSRTQSGGGLLRAQSESSRSGEKHSGAGAGALWRKRSRRQPRYPRYRRFNEKTSEILRLQHLSRSPARLPHRHQSGALPS